MALTERLALLISANADEALVSFDRLGKKMAVLDAQGARTGRGFGTAVTGGAVLAGLALGKMIKDGVQALEVQQRIDAQTQAVLKSTGSAAGITAKQVGQLAESISRYSEFSIDAVKASENVLLSFVAVKNQAGAGNDIFDRAEQSVANLSARFGTDLTTTARQLGRALQDPVAGMSALARSGVAFDAGTKKQIKSLAEQGRLLDAQKVLLDAVDKKVGGAAEAAGKAAAGGFAQFHNSLQELDKTLAKPILAPLTQGIHDLSEGLRLVNEHPVAVKIVEGIVGIGATAIIASKAIGILHRVQDSELAATVRGSAARNASAASLAREGTASELAASQGKALAAAEAASADVARAGSVAHAGSATAIRGEGVAAEVTATQLRAMSTAQLTALASGRAGAASAAAAAEAGAAAHSADATAIAREGTAAEVSAAQLRALAASETLAAGAATAGAAETGAATASRGLRSRFAGSATAGLAVFAADAYLVPKAIDAAFKIPSLLRARSLGKEISQAIQDYNGGKDTIGQQRALEGIGSQVDAARAAAAKGDYSKLAGAVKLINDALRDNANIYSLSSLQARDYAQNTQIAADAALKSYRDILTANRQQHALNIVAAEQESILGTDPNAKFGALSGKVAAARIALKSAQDAVTAAEHRISAQEGSRTAAIAAAQAALGRAKTTDQVAAAERRLAALRGTGQATAGRLTDAENSLARAKERVALANSHLNAAEGKANEAQGLSLKQVLANDAAAAFDEKRAAKGVQKLVKAGVSSGVLTDLLEVEKTAPGTIANLAADITQSTAKSLNKFKNEYVTASAALKDAPGAAIARTKDLAFQVAARRNASAYIASFRRQMDDARLILDRDLAPPAGYPKAIKAPITSGGQAYDPSHNPLLGGAYPSAPKTVNYNLRDVTIVASSPAQLSAALAQESRLAQLGLG